LIRKNQRLFVFLALFLALLSCFDVTASMQVNVTRRRRNAQLLARSNS